MRQADPSDCRKTLWGSGGHSPRMLNPDLAGKVNCREAARADALGRMYAKTVKALAGRGFLSMRRRPHP